MPITDNFNSYSVGVLAGQGNWVALINTNRVYDNAGNKAVSSTDDDTLNASYLNLIFPNDQYAKITIISTVGSNSYQGVMVRATGGGNGYILYASTYRTKLFKIVSNALTQLAISNTANGVAANDVLELRVTGTTLRCLKNGNPIAGLGDVNGDVTDSTFSSGKPGLITDLLSAAGIPLMDNFECTSNTTAALNATITETDTVSANIKAYGRINANISDADSISSLIKGHGRISINISESDATNANLGTHGLATSPISSNINESEAASANIKAHGRINANLSETDSISSVIKGHGRILININEADAINANLGTHGITTAHINSSISESENTNANIIAHGRLIALINEIDFAGGTVIPFGLCNFILNGVSNINNIVAYNSMIKSNLSALSIINKSQFVDSEINANLSEKSKITVEISEI